VSTRQESGAAAAGEHKLKVCMIGATGVGKTSLVRRFVSTIFSDVYRTTIGVKIESRRLWRQGRPVDLVLWDLSGEDEFQSVRPAYLRGAAGYLLVIDGTRAETVETALALQAIVRNVVGDCPFLALVNKTDLVASWEVNDTDLAPLVSIGWKVVPTSARTGAGVEQAFELLVDRILGPGEAAVETEAR
jgi:small GTP-binding protein